MSASIRYNLWPLSLFVATAVISSAGVASAAENAPRRTNVIMILADDLGYADVGFTGCKDIPTPNIDSIAKNGIRCANGYVSHPFCSPTRAGLMTGRYQQRFGHENNPIYNPADEVAGLPVDQITLPQVLKHSGYATGAVGKWHLGAAPKFHPNRRGFDEFYGFIGGGHEYLPTQRKASAEYTLPIQRNGTPTEWKPGDYLTDMLATEAASFVARHKADPFYLYLAFNAPHTPLQATEKYLDRFKTIKDEKCRTYAAMVSALDDGIGRVLAAVRDSGIERDTLILFCSDNGGPVGINGSSNLPLRAGKGTTYEGGIHVPFAIQWRGRLAEGTVYDYPVMSIDVFPTAIALAGGHLPSDRKIDGVNLLPYLLGEKKTPPHDVLFWRSGAVYGIRQGDSKMVGTTRGEETFDLKKDLSEKNDLSRTMPDAAKAIKQAWSEWNAQLIPPIFKSPQNGKRKAAPSGDPTEKSPD